MKIKVYYSHMENNEGTQQVVNEQIEEIVVEENNASTLRPMIRHLLLTLCILLTISIILFLIYQNGKSIYDKGL